MDLLKTRFKPEFLNRIDEIVLFNSLTDDVIDQIVEKFLNQLKDRLASKGIEFTYTKEAVEEIHQEAYDPIYGARPIRRFIQSQVETPLAREIIAGNVSKSVTLNCENHTLTFNS